MYILRLSEIPKSELKPVMEEIIALLGRIGDDFFPSPKEMGLDGASKWCKSLFYDMPGEEQYYTLGTRYDALVAAVGNHVVGFLSVYYQIPGNIREEFHEKIINTGKHTYLPKENVAFISTFYVDRGYRKIGVGKCLENELTDILEERNIPVVAVKTFTFGTCSLSGTSFYENNGYTVLFDILSDPGRKDRTLFPAMSNERLALDPGTRGYMKKI